MKKLFILLLGIGLFMNSFSQKGEKSQKLYTNPMEFYKSLQDGSYAANFTLQDLNGNTYTLYDYLDQGKTVFVDFFGYWCSPCWNFMNTHALENLYKEHGPAGAPGVDSNTTNDVMAFAIESSGDDASLACLQGDQSCSNTQGDWITAAGDLPLLPTYSPNSNQCVSDYNITYVPTIYKICPNREVVEVGQLSSADEYYATVSSCPAPASAQNDAALWSFDYPENYPYCVTNFEPQVTIQNNGTNNLTSVNIKTYIDGNEVSSYDWSGSLATYEITQITLPQVTMPAGSHTFKVELFNPNGTTDADNSNNSQEITVSSNPNGNHITIDILTDNYPDETTWDLKDENGNTLSSGGPLDQAQHHFTYDMCLANGCYDFTIYDAYGDGMDYNGVTGHVTLTANNDSTIADFSGSDFTSSKTVHFCLSGTSAINESKLSEISITPNPAEEYVIIKNANIGNLSIITRSGKVVLEKTLTSTDEKVDISKLNAGFYIVKIVSDNYTVTKPLVIVKK